jgi:hypothetical protein
VQSPLKYAATRSGLVSDAYQDFANYIERRGRESRRVQRLQLWVRERIAGFTSELTPFELNVCAQAAARYKAGDARLQASNPHLIVDQLLTTFSDEEWSEISRETRSYLRSIDTADQR